MSSLMYSSRHAELAAEPLGLLQRREAGVEPGLRLALDRQQVLVAPEERGPVAIDSRVTLPFIAA